MNRISVTLMKLVLQYFIYLEKLKRFLEEPQWSWGRWFDHQAFAQPARSRVWTADQFMMIIVVIWKWSLWPWSWWCGNKECWSWTWWWRPSNQWLGVATAPLSGLIHRYMRKYHLIKKTFPNENLIIITITCLHVKSFPFKTKTKHFLPKPETDCDWPFRRLRVKIAFWK